MNPGLILGYHGCSASLANALLHGKEKHLRPSVGKYEWLGDGIYCWEDSYARAVEWAKDHVKKGDTPSVIGVLIKPGNCLDLLDSAEIDMLKNFAENLLPLYEKAEGPFPVNNGGKHEYDCALINRYREYVRSERSKVYDTVRAAFMEGERICEDKHSDLFVRTHIQWAICNPACIVGYFRPVPVQTS